jgi:flavin reductase (DIM6/NTAB) family NADH-FMN oxidoreductase RutF
MAKLDFDPAVMERLRIYKIVAGSVLPRPIGLISTVGRNGQHNLAPFSFFNALSSDPPYVALSISRHIPDGRPKDTLRNIRDTGEFVANVVSEEIAQAQNECGREYPPDVDEFAVTGLTPARSTAVRPPAVLESKVNFECRLFKEIELPKSSYTLVLGEVVHMRVDEDVMEPSGRINLARLRPVGRLVGNAYCRISDSFTLERDTFDTLALIGKSGAGGG